MAASILFRKRRLMLCLPRQVGGKTELGIRVLEDLTARPFTSSALFLAKSKSAGKKIAREKFMRLFDPKIFEVNTELAYLKKCPTSAVFMDSVDKDPDRIRGGTYAAIHWSEVAFSKFDQGVTVHDVWSKIIKPTTDETDGYTLLESTNNGKNGWHELWHNAKELGFDTLKVGLADMVYLGLVTPERYEKLKAETHPDIFEQEYNCGWVTFQGKVYPEFTDYHKIKDMPAPKYWQQVAISIDWGYDPSATSVLFGYIENGCMYIFDEHFAMKELAIHTAFNIKQKLEKYQITNFACVADHEEDRIRELQERDIPCSKADKVDVLGARMSIKEAFYLNKLFVDPIKCPNLVRDLEQAVWHAKKESELDPSQCTIGHYDCEAALRYLMRAFSSMEEESPIINPHVGIDNVSAQLFRDRLERGQP